ncbi:VOC family protein [Micromonospora sp. NPDC048830]|uniref:VOC family protein n=1 Tax=Micromonospora sp. NPDC048830 TaxID=3364257 RepID=UPI003719F529
MLNPTRVKGLHHVAFAEGQGAELAETFQRTLGLPVTSVERVPGFNERMLDLGNCSLQGLEVTGEGVVKRSVDRRGPGLHHIAFEVDDIAATMSELRDHGIDFIDPEPRTGGGGHLIAFAYPKSFGGVLVEFVEVRSEF